MFMAQIKEEIKKIAGENVAFSIERPENSAYGDYSSNVALVLAKKQVKNPKEVAEELKTRLLSNPIAKWLEKIEVAGPGFLNFFLKEEAVLNGLETVLKEKNNFGKSKLLSGKKIIIEYTDPNPFKEFHIGHLMSNSIGESLARIIEFNGAEVKRANYQGDVGLHVAKAIWAIKNVDGLQEIDLLNGKAYVAGNKAYSDSEKDKKKIAEINKKIYDGSDKKLSDLYEKHKRKSLSYFEAVYGILGMRKIQEKQHFDFYFFESETGKKGKEIVEENLKKGIFEESDGAIIFKGEKYGLHTRVFINSDSLPTYEAKELGLAVIKNEKYQFDISLVVTGNEIIDYFRVILTAEKQIYPELAEKTKHVPHGMLRLPSGKMSSRTGEIIAAESLWDMVKEKLKERLGQNEKVSESARGKILDIVTLGAIKYSILRHSVGSDIVFDFEKSLALEGDSGPYIQYVYARTRSVMERAKGEGVSHSFSKAPGKLGALERLIVHIPDVVEDAYVNLNPNVIGRYLLELAGEFNTFYEKQKIIGLPESPYYVALTEAVSISTKNGLNLLGIEAPDRM